MGNNRSGSYPWLTGEIWATCFMQIVSIILTTTTIPDGQKRHISRGMDNKDLLYIAQGTTQYSVITSMRKASEKITLPYT